MAASRNLKEEASTHAIRDNDVQHGIPTVVFGRTYYFAFDSTEKLQKKNLVVTGKRPRKTKTSFCSLMTIREHVSTISIPTDKFFS